MLGKYCFYNTAQSQYLADYKYFLYEILQCNNLIFLRQFYYFGQLSYVLYKLTIQLTKTVADSAKVDR